MKNILTQKNLPFLLLIGLIAKSILASAPIFDSIAILALSSLFGFKLWLDHIKKPDFSQILFDKIEEIKKLTKDQISAVDVNNKETLSRLDGKVSTIALANAQKRKPDATGYGW